MIPSLRELTLDVSVLDARKREGLVTNYEYCSQRAMLMAMIHLRISAEIYWFGIHKRMARVEKRHLARES